MDTSMIKDIGHTCGAPSHVEHLSVEYSDGGLHTLSLY